MENEENNVDTLNKQIAELKQVKNNLQTEIIQLDDEILFQEFGVYKPLYAFANLDEYKSTLDDIRNKQKELIKTGKAAFCRTEWKVNGSEKEGKKLIAENVKQTIRNFNIECDICIDKVKFSNYENMENRIIKSYEMQNKLNETNSIEISEEYLRLKMQELHLAYEYQQKKKEEREELRLLREQQREEEQVAKEIEAKRLELEKEQTHYQNALKRINEQIEVEESEERKAYLIEKKNELDGNIEDVSKAMIDLDYREANHRAGYVYIISNIGAFGEGVYKIGMTRRLEPEDRIAELSGAAVPFRYDIHALIFSNDAPKLEAALHNAFADKKVNLVNGRKEFFRVSLDEIKKVVQENHDKTVEFKNIPDAEQFRESEMIRKKQTYIYADKN
jgi:predicted transport protein